MMVMVEGRCPRCWGCKQIGHIAKFCPQRPENKEKASVTTTTTKDAVATTTTINKEAEAQGLSQVQPKNNQEGWTEVTRKRRGSPKKGGKSLSSSPPQKQIKAPPAPATPATPTPAPVTPTPATQKPAASPTTSTATPKTPATTVPPVSPKKKIRPNQPEDMETNTNLKRRRDSGEGAAKKICPEQPKAGPSSQLQKQQPPPPPPLKSYNPHKPLTKLSPSHPNKNNILKDAAAPNKSFSQGHNQVTGPSPWIWPERNPFPHLAHLPYQHKNYSQPDKDMTLLPVKKQIGRKVKN